MRPLLPRNNYLIGSNLHAFQLIPHRCFAAAQHDRNLALLKLAISRFPVSLVLGTKLGQSAAIRTKQLIDYVEQVNKDCNSAAENFSFLDPNDYKILLDYQLLKDGKPLKNYLGKPAEACLEGLDSKFQQLMLVQMTKDGFTGSTSLLHNLSDEDLGRRFDLLACVLNAPKFPVLLGQAPGASTSNIRMPPSKTSQSEEKTVQDNLYMLASLGLTKVSKLLDGSLVLTRK